MTFVYPNLQVNGTIKGSKFVYRSAVEVFDNSLAGITATWSSPTLTLTALSTGTTYGALDGITSLALDDRVLLTDMANATPSGITAGKEASFNGIWRITGGTTSSLTLVRASDLNEGDSALLTMIPIKQGTVGAGTVYKCTTASTVSSDTNNLTFVRQSLPKTGTPLEVTEGGTGAATFTTNAVLKGNATGAVTASGVTVDASNNVTIPGDIMDANGNKIVGLTGTASAVNSITIKNSATTVAPIIQSTGEVNTGIDVKDSNGNSMLTLVAGATDARIDINETSVSAQGTAADLDLNAASKGAGNVVLVSGATGVCQVKATTNAGTLKIYEPPASGTNSVGITVPAIAADYTLTLPPADGTANQLLQTDGAGTLGWKSIDAFSIIYSMSAQELLLSTAYEIIGYLPWVNAKFSTFTTVSVVFEYYTATPSDTLSLQIGTAASPGAYYSSTTIAPGHYNTTWTAVPSADTRVQIQASASSGSIYGMMISFA